MTTIAESERNWHQGKSPSFPLSFTKMHYQLWLLAILGLAHQQLTYDATHDGLTGLLNRSTFYALLQHSCDQRDACFALICLDLNGFKAINDSRGHLAGDAILREVATEMNNAIRDGDAIARTGGDEFLIKLGGAGPTEAAVICKRLTAAIHRTGVSAAAGIAAYLDGDTPDALVARADRAMYAAKRRGESCWMDGHSTCPSVPLDLITEIDKALEAGDFVPFYQPIAAAHNRRFLGYEALARWRVGDSWRSPADFLHIIQDAGWLPRLDWLILRQACADLEHFEGQWLSINVSGPTLAERGFRDRLVELLNGYWVDPRRINLEISETIAIGVDPIVSDGGILPKLGAINQVAPVGLMVDDYGSAYAQLQALMALCQSLPSVRFLKLDSALVSDVDSNPVKLTICRNAIELAHGLNLQAIAEGVETEPEAMTLRGLHCDQLQGYLLGRPLPIDEYAVYPSQETP
jgi:diguanylate cyclase